MSGRDFKLFLASHMSQIGQKDNRMVTQAMAGHKPLFEAVDYAQLRELKHKKHLSGDAALQKIHQLKELSLESKRRNRLAVHRNAWETEMRALIKSFETLSHDLTLLFPRIQEQGSVGNPHGDCMEGSKRAELGEFVENTLKPVYELIEDLKSWTKDDTIRVSEEKMVKDVLNSVKCQQRVVFDKLSREESALEEDLNKTLSECNLHESSKTISVGLPLHVQNLFCPDEDLKEQCLSEFQKVDDNYMDGVKRLELKYEKVGSQPYGGWTCRDHTRFEHIVKQYAGVTHDKRKLYIDRLIREMPHKSLDELRKHEQWCTKDRYFRARLQDLFLSWQRDRQDLELEVTSLIYDACAEYEKWKANLHERAHQRFMCNALHEKLYHMALDRCELMRLENIHRLEESEESSRKAKQKARQELKRRSVDKEKVDEFKAKQEWHASLMQASERLSMFQLQEKRAAQRVIDQDRVKFREERYREKLEELKEKERRVRVQEGERERQLQAIRDKVVVNVSSDPTRMIGPTEAVVARLEASGCEKHPRAPLFNVYTYSVDQIGADKRLRLENALRRENLHTTEYGRNVIANAAPPSKPRADHQSSVFKKKSRIFAYKWAPVTWKRK